ncbi:hypothetical protein [Oceanobacillus neutriphilus]|uniref:Uncharacterized protein n=1 Tax=Oceanobacillus neutriphilus TaxID=531815 RepID=A0ABQ2NSF8_9BACI|nr:hypothetical protein [Oceanobacillus neutriphilus]GGP09229.1 hypothetical protein GCM10011346_12460 [Oceanobacillus neutriphilus]
MTEGNNEVAQAEGKDAQQRELKHKEEKQVEGPSSEAREKVKEMTDEEIEELINKNREGNMSGDNLTEEEIEILKAIPAEQFYNIMGMTDDEVKGYIDGYQRNINGIIIGTHKNPTEYEENLLPGKAEFEWIKENYDFDSEYDKESINEILELIDEYNEGNQKAIFSLKYVFYELNEKLNPKSIEETYASDLSLSNTVRIQNGKDPIDENE